MQKSIALGAAIGFHPPAVSADDVQTFHLTAKPGRAQIVPEEYGDTAVWCF
ncbi:MAG: hypothetical protein P8Y12_03370 [Gammaproteobacteria bacterium]